MAATCTKPMITGSIPRPTSTRSTSRKSGPLMVDILDRRLPLRSHQRGHPQRRRALREFLNPTFPAAYNIGHSLDHSSRDVGKTGPDGAKWQSWYDTQLKNRQWRMSLITRFLTGLAATPEGTGTMLDNTLMLSTSEFSCGAVHSVADMPILIAGKAGGKIRTGRQINYNLKAAANNAWTLDYQTQTSMHNLFTSIPANLRRHRQQLRFHRPRSKTGPLDSADLIRLAAKPPASERENRKTGRREGSGWSSPEFR